MLYKIMSIRISDSKDLKCAKIETHPMKNDQNDEKIKIFWNSQNRSGIIPESRDYKNHFLKDFFMQNHRFYENLAINNFYLETPGHDDSRHSNSQFSMLTHVCGVVWGPLGILPHGAKHSLCSLALGWPPAENRGSATLLPKINLSLIFRSCWR